MSNTDLIIGAIKENKPNIGESSLKTYISILKNLFKKYGKDNEFNIKWFSEETDRLKDLEEVKPNIKKTILSALISITKDTHNKKYKKVMMDSAQEVQATNLKQEKSEAQSKNWISQEELLNKFIEMRKQVKSLWTKPQLTKNDYTNLQNLILVLITSGLMIPPRRSKDWSEFKIKNISDKDNFLKGNKLFFNTYKGSDNKGQQIIELPSGKKDLVMIFKKFIKLNPHDYLLVDSQGKKMNSVKINQHLEKIFNKKISVNLLRHSYVSEKYPITQVAELTKDAADMGSSVNMMLNQYIKKASP
jgi:hypothetical protein